MKKLISLILALCLVAALFAGCAGQQEPSTPAGSETPSNAPSEDNVPQEDPTATPHQIGVFVTEWNQNMLMMRDYYDNYIAPAFNVTFVYSDGTSNDVEKEISFVENCATMGVEALISWNPLPTDNNIAVGAKCEEYGIWYVYNNSATDHNLDQFPHFVGVGGAAPEPVAAQFAEMTDKVLGDGEKHNVILHNGLCFTGVEQHIQTAASILDTLASKYGLTYAGGQTTREMVTTINSQTELDTGTDMKVFLEPTQIFNITPDIYFNILKDGVYDTVIFTGPAYNKIETAVDDVEKQTGKNIHVISIAAVTDTTRNSFATLDSTGHQSLDAALIKNTTSCGVLFCLAYNALTGHAADLRIDNATQLFDAPMWTCYSLEEYEKIAQLDNAETGLYSWTVDEIKNACFAFNPDLTVEGLQKIAADKLDLAAVLEANGIN